MRLCIQGTGALGDTMMLSAIAKAFKNTAYEVTVIVPNRFRSLVASLVGIRWVEEINRDVEYDMFIDLREYLRDLIELVARRGGQWTQMPHLVQLMMLRVKSRLPCDVLSVGAGDVELMLASDEVEAAKERVADIRAANPGKSLVLVAPYAHSGNRSLPVAVLNRFANLVSANCVLVELVGPEGKPRSFGDAVPLATPCVRDIGALALVADRIVAVDSGPFHVVCAALQAARNHSVHSDLTVSLNKVVLVLGSSSETVVSYRGVRSVVTSGRCPVAPCHAHGYAPVSMYTAAFGRNFFPHTYGNASACVNEDYETSGTSDCMRIDPAELAASITR